MLITPNDATKLVAASSFALRCLRSSAGRGQRRHSQCVYLATYSRAAQSQGPVAAYEASAAALRDAGIAVLNLNDVAHIPCYFDGADEIDASIAMIKGEGAPLTREKIIASASGKFIGLIDASIDSAT